MEQNTHIPEQTVTYGHNKHMAAMTVALIILVAAVAILAFMFLQKSDQDVQSAITTIEDQWPELEQQIPFRPTVGGVDVWQNITAFNVLERDGENTMVVAELEDGHVVVAAVFEVNNEEVQLIETFSSGNDSAEDFTTFVQLYDVQPSATTYVKSTLAGPNDTTVHNYDDWTAVESTPSFKWLFGHQAEPVSVETTGNVTDMQTYTNNEYGFSFHYPTHITVEESQNTIGDHTQLNVVLRDETNEMTSLLVNPHGIGFEGYNDSEVVDLVFNDFAVRKLIGYYNEYPNGRAVFYSFVDTHGNEYLFIPATEDGETSSALVEQILDSFMFTTGEDQAWDTYRKDNLFEVDYPKGWEVTPLTGAVEGGQGYIGVRIENPETKGDLSSEYIHVNVSPIYGQDEGYGLDDLIDERYRGKTYSGGQEIYTISDPLILSGQKAYMVTLNESDGGAQYIVEHADIFYILNLGHAQDPLRQQLLDGFRFID